jgi:hypothetical protein
MRQDDDYNEDSDPWDEDALEDGYHDDDGDDDDDVAVEELDFEAPLIRDFSVLNNDEDVVDIEDEDTAVASDEDDADEELTLGDGEE